MAVSTYTPVVMATGVVAIKDDCFESRWRMKDVLRDKDKCYLKKKMSHVQPPHENKKLVMKNYVLAMSGKRF